MSALLDSDIETIATAVVHKIQSCNVQNIRHKPYTTREMAEKMRISEEQVRRNARDIAGHYMVGNRHLFDAAVVCQVVLTGGNLLKKKMCVKSASYV